MEVRKTMTLTQADKTIRANFEPCSLRDLNSGQLVEIDSPGSFELETVLLDSAYYKYRDRTFRFLLCKARELGLKVA